MKQMVQKHLFHEFVRLRIRNDRGSDHVTTATQPTSDTPLSALTSCLFIHQVFGNTLALVTLSATTTSEIPSSGGGRQQYPADSVRPQGHRAPRQSGWTAPRCDIQLRQLQRGADDVIAAAGAVLQPIPPAGVSDSVCTARWSAFSIPSASSGGYSTPEAA